MTDSRTGRVLIVDDERPLLSLMEQYVRRLGYETVGCRTAQEAWQAFEAAPGSFSLVMADMVLPQGSSREMVLKMLALNPDVRVLVCTGMPFDMSMLPGEVHAKVAHLQKPFSPQMLAEAIGKLLGSDGG